MADLKYNVYYSTSQAGPWTLANSTPLDHNEDLNQYTVTGLNSGTSYFFQIVGGVMEDGEFVALINQPLRPNSRSAYGVEGAGGRAIALRTFAPTARTVDILGHQFEVTI